MSLSNLIKTSMEIKSMRRSCSLSSRLHILAMGHFQLGMSEKDLAGSLVKFHGLTGSKNWSYPLIVGSGERSTILHARPTGRRPMEDELVLVDMGVHFEGMASDITRTWPVGQKFTAKQKTIYEIVLKAQKEVIKRVRPGTNLSELHEVCCHYLRRGLLAKKVMRTGNIKNVFPHRTSHWIGRKVHDICPYEYQDSTPIQLAPGMCFTVEPGLYFRGTRTGFEGIGVRIEDVILVTEEGCEVLSESVPKEISEVEEIRSWFRSGEK